MCEYCLRGRGGNYWLGDDFWPGWYLWRIGGILVCPSDRQEEAVATKDAAPLAKQESEQARSLAVARPEPKTSTSHSFCLDSRIAVDHELEDVSIEIRPRNIRRRIFVLNVVFHAVGHCC